MAEFIPRDIRMIKYDLSTVKIGESIFCKNADETNVVLCVRNDETYWRIYDYDITNKQLVSFDSDDPNYRILTHNEIFDVEKTKWVKEYFEKVDQSLSLVRNFESSLRFNFI